MENVTARMYDTKPVKETMTLVVNSIYSILGLPNPKAIPKATIFTIGEAEKKDQDQGNEEPGELLADEEVDGNEGAPDTRDTNGAERDTKLLQNDSEKNPDLDASSEDLSRYGGVVGGSSDEDRNLDSDSEDGIQRPAFNIRSSPHPSDPLISLSDMSRSPSPVPKSKKSTKKAQQANSKPGSTFLPTLMGGYWSGSDESATEDEGIAPAPRKNRRGQQARRAIWEKKFGAKANHLKNQASGRVRDKDWDPKRGARGANERRPRGGSRGRGGRTGFTRSKEQSTGEDAIPLQPRARGMGKKDDAGPLHPSWEAAKKAKEAATKLPSFEGKKVVFQ